MDVVGVDPGLKGGLCWLSGDGTDAVAIPMPVKDGVVDINEVFSFLEARGVDRFWIEQVNAFPTGSRSSAFTFGGTYHTVLATARAYSQRHGFVTLHQVRPTVWKKYFNLTSDKKDTFQWIRENSPRLVSRLRCKEKGKVKDHDGMAEAYLIAEYGRRQTHAN
jgi:hypothetical protein